MPDLTGTVTVDALTQAAVAERAQAQGVTAAQLAGTAIAEMAKSILEDSERQMLAAIREVWPKFTAQEKATVVTIYKAARAR